MKPVYPHAIVNVTLACNLKCRYCVMCVPYYEKPWHPTLDYIKETTDRAFALGDYEIFEFSGGEASIRDDLPDILEYALKYKDNVKKKINIVTNGFNIPSKELISVMKKYGDKFHFLIDNYGEELAPNSPKIYEMVKNEGILCELRDFHSTEMHYGGWVNFMADGIKHSEEDAEKIYSNCAEAQALLHCCNIIKGILMPCHMLFQLRNKGISQPEPHEFIDLFDDNEPIEMKRKKMAGFQTVKSLSSCKYCLGLNKDRERIVPGEQIPDEEYKTITKITIPE